MSISEERNLNIEVGDTIEVNCQGVEIKGVVHSAIQYGWIRQPSDWYIEFDSTDGAHYWKQGLDGGHVRIVHKASWDTEGSLK